jgi:hypothetical protein
MACNTLHGKILRVVVMKSFSQNSEAPQWRFLQHRKRREILFATPDASETTTADYQVGYGRVSLLCQISRNPKNTTPRARISGQKVESLYLVKLRLRLAENRWTRFFGRAEHQRPTVTSTSEKPN